MASTFTTNLRIEKQATGENKSTWGAKANNGFELFEDAISGHVAVPLTGTLVDLPGANGAIDTPRNAMLTFTGTLAADCTVTIPEVSKTYVVRNNTVGGFAVIFKVKNSAAGVKQYTLRSGQQKFIYIDTSLDMWSSDHWIAGSSTATQRWSVPAYVDAAGAMEIGKWLDFHNASADATDFAVRLGTIDAAAAPSVTDFYITPAGGAARKIWNDGNDGPSSGLDADKVDGFHAADLGFPPGTSMLFMQSAAPTGWVKQTDYNDRVLRIVSGAVTVGGALAFSSVFASQAVSGTIGGTAISLAQMPAHSHTLNGSGTIGAEASHTHGNGTYAAASAGAHTHSITGVLPLSGQSGSFGFDWVGGGSLSDSTPNTNSGGAHTHDVTGTSSVGSSHTHGFSDTYSIASAGSGSTHTHTFTGTPINLAIAYVDAIICTKS
jgi:hypothetical protein